MHSIEDPKSTKLRTGLKIAHRVADELEVGRAELNAISKRNGSATSGDLLHDLASGLGRARQSVLAAIEKVETHAPRVQLPLFADVPVS